MEYTLAFIKRNTLVIDANPAELLKLILSPGTSSVSARIFAGNGESRNSFGNRRRLTDYLRHTQFHELKWRNISQKCMIHEK